MPMDVGYGMALSRANITKVLAEDTDHSDGMGRSLQHIVLHGCYCTAKFQMVSMLIICVEELGV